MYGLGRESLFGQLRYGFFQLVKIRQLNNKVSSVQTERINCFKKPRNVTNVCTVVVWEGGGGGEGHEPASTPHHHTIVGKIPRLCMCGTIFPLVFDQSLSNLAGNLIDFKAFFPAKS